MLVETRAGPVEAVGWTERFSAFRAWLEAVGFEVAGLPDWRPDTPVQVVIQKPFAFRFYVRKETGGTLHVVHVTAVDRAKLNRWRRRARGFVDRDVSA